jgi:hypothetical protein
MARASASGELGRAVTDEMVAVDRRPILGVAVVAGGLPQLMRGGLGHYAPG